MATLLLQPLVYWDNRFTLHLQVNSGPPQTGQSSLDVFNEEFLVKYRERRQMWWLQDHCCHPTLECFAWSQLFFKLILMSKLTIAIYRNSRGGETSGNSGHP